MLRRNRSSQKRCARILLFPSFCLDIAFIYYFNKLNENYNMVTKLIEAVLEGSKPGLKAVTLIPFPLLLFLLSLSLLFLSFSQEAEAGLLTALQLRPSYWEAHIALARLLSVMSPDGGRAQPAHSEGKRTERVSMCMCVRVWMLVYACVRVRACVRACVRTCVRACVRTCVRACLYHPCIF